MSEWVEFFQDKKVRKRWDSFTRREKAEFLVTAPILLGACYVLYVIPEWLAEKKERSGLWR
jgi:hypothetical protein